MRRWRVSNTSIWNIRRPSRACAPRRTPSPGRSYRKGSAARRAARMPYEWKLNLELIRPAGYSCRKDNRTLRKTRYSRQAVLWSHPRSL
jgi:hypothetical protein